MLTDFVRDHAFTIGWFGLMAFMWFGWSQENPPASWRLWLGGGSLLGAAVAGCFIPAVVRTWEAGSALVGPLMGLSLLLFATASILVFLQRHGAPW